MTRLILKTTTPASGMTPEQLAFEILQARGINPTDYLGAHQLASLTPPFSLKNIEHACVRLIKALQEGEHIALITDHDCDGQTSCATLYWSLTKVFEHPPALLDYYIGHRTEEGYGLSRGLLDRVLAAKKRPSLIITADCGSSDHATIAELAQLDIDVIITDHHTVPPQGPPDQAFAVINPNQPGCSFPDKNIAGCCVAWFFMVATRFYWHKQEPQKKFHSLAPALDFVSIGTMADCVSLASSHNNRIVVRHGLKQIRAQKRACWRALKRTFAEVIDSDFLIFKLIPLINADGRLSNALTGVGFMLSSDTITAQEKLAELIQCNEQRRFLQKKQLAEAKKIIFEENLATQAGVVIRLYEQGHAGIHGVTASRILEQYQKMVILFSPSHEQGLIVGSARSPDSVSIKKMLDSLSEQHPGLIQRYGGHHQAAGLALETHKFEEFRQATQAYLQACTHEASDRHEVAADIFLADFESVSFDFFSRLELLLEPFGKGFQRPTFVIHASVVGGRVMGADKNHLQLDLQDCRKGIQIKALLFFTEIASQLLDKLLSEKIFFCGQFVLQEFQKEHSVAFFIQSFFNKQFYYQEKTKELRYESLRCDSKIFDEQF